MQFVVKAAGVAHRVAVPVAPPQRGDGGLAVRAAGAGAPGRGLRGAERKCVVSTCVLHTSKR